MLRPLTFFKYMATVFLEFLHHTEVFVIESFCKDFIHQFELLHVTCYVIL